MHTLQPKHSKLKKEELEALLKKLNVALSQLPKINQEDPGLPENCEVGDVIKIERKLNDKINIYYRIVV
ncbi:MAG: DNA-directed RNA polymerase subunit H [Nanoarchaeota archaeon]|nr:DNA-directed RNA polymerase subunit H [Nanoarchaeota archaeon]